MDIKQLILKELSEKDSFKTTDIMVLTGFSRAYITRFLGELLHEGKIVRIGKANKVRYVLSEKLGEDLLNEKKRIHKIIRNESISEDLILKDIKRESTLFDGLGQNIVNILDYAVTEMLNNAIEHSGSAIIDFYAGENNNSIEFTVTDKGIGIFNNLKMMHNLSNTMEAIQQLLKGKRTTLPAFHSGEGIFFTSRVSDYFEIKSSDKLIIFDNLLPDLFIKNTKLFKGTRIFFRIARNSGKELKDIFDRYTDDNYSFSTTEILIKLYRENTSYISRSQARRVVSGLEEFKTIRLDFQEVETLGQAFADEIFRVWKNSHPEINILYSNANENITFMIKRAQSYK
ncbi:MAG: DUF4325 domain-containing protein [Spirochaetales bacterium]|nr:DUF4325 domain-containing protein [Spirochaetales bacterium]